MPIQSNITDVPVEQALRKALSSFPTGVVAVCGRDREGTSIGMALNSFTSISLDPPLVAISATRSSRTWPRLKSLPVLGLSVLGDGQEGVSRQLAAREGDRFAGLACQETKDGAIYIDGAALWLTCRLHQEVDGGDHVIALLSIAGLHHFPDVDPLVFHLSRYRSVSE